MYIKVYTRFILVYNGYSIYYTSIIVYVRVNCNILECTVPSRYILLLLDRWTVEELKKVIEAGPGRGG